jgi:hypothetical protein
MTWMEMDIGESVPQPGELALHGAPRFDSAGLSSNSYRQSSNFFETFGAFSRRGWEAKRRYPAENEGDDWAGFGLVLVVTATP